MIEFECPQGHKLNCPDDKAGSAGQCPKCGERFLIPSDGDDEGGLPPVSPPEAPSLAPPTGGNGDGLAGGGPSDDGDDEIVFLCPNGHRLSGPSTLQGRPGQCPHCGSKFRIPIYDDDEPERDARDDTVVDEEIPIGTIVEAQDPGYDDSPPIGLTPLPGGGFAPSEGTLPEDNPSLHPAPGIDLGVGPHPVAQVFARLWHERNNGGIVELTLSDGSTLAPQWYAVDLSMQSHGVFAIEDADGTFTLTAVAWDSLSKVSVRSVSDLPRDLFG